MNNLQYYREKNGLTLTELSNKTGIGESSINRAEKGVTDLNGQRWAALANALGCTVDDLLGRR